MGNITRPAAQDGVEATVAGHRVAELAAFPQTGKIRRTKIPAEGPLANIAGEGTGVANLRRCRFASGIRKNQEFLADRRMLFDLGQLRQRADAKAAALFLDVVEAGN